MMTSLHVNGFRLALVLLLQLAWTVVLADDNVASLPGSWADKLLSVPVPNLEGQAADIRSGLDEDAIVRAAGHLRARPVRCLRFG